MAKFLIVEDEAYIRSQWRQYLESGHHLCQEAEDVQEALDAVKISQNEQEPFDLILLDHDLGDEYGLDVIQDTQGISETDYWQHRFIVITAYPNPDLARQYAKHGCIGHLIKPVSQAQFWATIEAALERRDIYEQQQDWEKAYAVLEDLGLIESLGKLQEENKAINEQYEILRAIHEKLLQDLESLKGNEKEIGEAYERAERTLNISPGSIESIRPFLQPFRCTDAFWKDVEDLFKSNRLGFYLLQTYLKRIADNSTNLPTKAIKETNKFYEYRVGRSFRLYYRKIDSGISMERFGDKKVQPEIIQYLHKIG